MFFIPMLSYTFGTKYMFMVERRRKLTVTPWQLMLFVTRTDWRARQRLIMVC